MVNWTAPSTRHIQRGLQEFQHRPGVLQAASPDEAALVVAAKILGAFFFRRPPSTVVVRQLEPSGQKVDNEYQLLAVLEFNSTRKRQSVIVRQPDGNIRLYCKVGAACWVDL